MGNIFLTDNAENDLFQIILFMLLDEESDSLKTLKLA